MSSTTQVDNELAALKAELGTGGVAAAAAARRGRACRRPRPAATGAGAEPAQARAPDGDLTQHQAGPGPDLPHAHDRASSSSCSTASFIGILIAVGSHSLVLILVIAVGLLFCQYWFSAKIAMYAMHAKEVTPEQAPELHGVVDRLCALADMPKPKVAIATTDIPNAFATGRSPKSAVVCVTSGLLRRLDEPEVEAVLSHELSHVAHRDVAVMTIASGLGMIAGLLTRVMFYSEIFGGGRGGNNQGGGQVGADRDDRLAGVGRRLLHQLPADHGAVALPRAGGRPLGRAADRPAVAAGLGAGQDHRRDGAHPDQGPAGRRAVQRLLLHPGRGQRRPPRATGGGFSFGNLFRTHPTLEQRLAQLDALERQLGQAG